MCERSRLQEHLTLYSNFLHPCRTPCRYYLVAISTKVFGRNVFLKVKGSRTVSKPSGCPCGQLTLHDPHLPTRNGMPTQHSTGYFFGILQKRLNSEYCYQVWLKTCEVFHRMIPTKRDFLLCNPVITCRLCLCFVSCRRKRSLHNNFIVWINNICIYKYAAAIIWIFHNILVERNCYFSCFGVLFVVVIYS